MTQPEGTVEHYVVRNLHLRDLRKRREQDTLKEALRRIRTMTQPKGTVEYYVVRNLHLRDMRQRREKDNHRRRNYISAVQTKPKDCKNVNYKQSFQEELGRLRKLLKDCLA